jgi:nuclear GTP-binding protein
VLDRNVRLLDSPGVVFDDKTALLGNCVDADSIDDPIPPVDALLKRCKAESLMMTYNIPAFPQGNTMMFLALVAKSYGRVLKGGIPDKIGAARSVLKDWNCGKIPYYTIPPKDAEPDVSKGGAVIVSSFGAEFDLSAFDDEVLNSLKDSDEMDFVELVNEDEVESTRVDELASYLATGDNMDEDSDDEMKDENTFRSKVAEADDFDFKTM